MTGDLVAFLRARLDEDARIACWAEEGAGQSWEARFTDHLKEHMGLAETGCSPVFVDGFLDVAFGAAEHAARHDPARTLAEVEAWQQLVKMHGRAVLRDGGGAQHFDTTTVCRSCEPNHQFPKLSWPCPTLRVLALPYADHPDYREEWRP